ncbi:NADP-dependent 3-hydroxy acid dehydrogenase YdfG [Tamilnaduibacter salinus]|uniref:NADP-dependent 3-hydroxy acid dehydrogenase YdfG n=1 Tax=Tamilnaduibacter salinus TaxID=1484056 RepID=A0A2U1CTM1_9GAMM|nr:SDR family oxidoreductase [Tamilnaduibacter salinus]PVY70008.1 NADP-dependent 3-hydroxy acid dehydrogenase YdfG [Tamilnaduibacter salinus]
MKRILITGAASGIGRATATLFARNGWTVGLLDVNNDALVSLSDELAGAWYQRLDVTSHSDCIEACEAFAEAHDGLDVLFNCAGILRMGAFEDIAADQHAQIINVNVNGLMNMSLAALPHLKKGDQPAVINMSSASALYGTPDFASYSASKFAVRGLTEALNIEWERQGIRVVDIMPPFVKTPMLDEAEYRAPVVDRLGVNLSADDIAGEVYKAANGPTPVHNPVGGLFRLMTLMDKVLPSRSTKWTMSWLSRH